MNPGEKMSFIVSPLRIRILESLMQEKHPEELAREFKITRQAVDKHLSLLYSYGLVDKRIKAETRPMVFYQITSEGEEFLQNFENIAEGHFVSVRKRYKEELFTLDRMLVSGELTEREYKRMKNALNERFGWVMEEWR